MLTASYYRWAGTVFGRNTWVSPSISGSDLKVVLFSWSKNQNVPHWPLCWPHYILLLKGPGQACLGGAIGSVAVRATWLQWLTSLGSRPRQGDHLSGKPGNVRDFDSCQWNVRDFTKSQGSVRENILLGKSGLKLFILSCIVVTIQVFSTSMGMIWVTLNMLSAVNHQRISHCLESGHPRLAGSFASGYSGVCFEAKFSGRHRGFHKDDR